MACRFQFSVRDALSGSTLNAQILRKLRIEKTIPPGRGHAAPLLLYPPQPPNHPLLQYQLRPSQDADVNNNHSSHPRDQRLRADADVNNRNSSSNNNSHSSNSSNNNSNNNNNNSNI